MSQIVPEVLEINPGIARVACSDLVEDLIRTLRVQRTEQRAWANRISEGREKYMLPIGNAVADQAKPEFREDVRSRKQTVDTGFGLVLLRAEKTG